MPKSIYRIVPRDTLDPGEVCRVRIQDGDILVSCAEGHITPELVERLNETKAIVMETGRWQLQHRDESPEMIDPKRAEHRGVASARYEIATEGQLPEGELCARMARPGEILWLVDGRHMSAEFAAQINAYLLRIVGDGLLRQHWGQESPHGQPSTG